MEKTHTEGTGVVQTCMVRGTLSLCHPLGSWLIDMTWSGSPTTNHSVGSRDLHHSTSGLGLLPAYPAVRTSSWSLPGHCSHTGPLPVPPQTRFGPVAAPLRVLDPPREGPLTSSSCDCFRLRLWGLAKPWPLTSVRPPPLTPHYIHLRPHKVCLLSVISSEGVRWHVWLTTSPELSVGTCA